jgi:hypothetical protein
VSVSLAVPVVSVGSVVLGEVVRPDVVVAPDPAVVPWVSPAVPVVPVLPFEVDDAVAFGSSLPEQPDKITVAAMSPGRIVVMFMVVPGRLV